ncbi:MAG: TolB-like translocation protein [Myxococcales bacterium]
MVPIALLVLAAVHGPPPPKPLALPAVAGLPALASPSFTPDGKRVLVVRSGPAAAALYLIPLAVPSREQAVELAPVEGLTWAALSHDGKRIAWLASGELWLAAAPGGDSPKDPERLYPPAAGDAPLGVKLGHAIWGPDDSWLLLQSPSGWARAQLDPPGLTPLAAHPVDLTGGNVVLGGDGTHAAFVRPTSGPGWINGAKVIAVNVATGQARLADFENDYTEVVLLPDAQLAGKDASGNLWVLRGKSRILWFQPPAVAGSGSIGDYALSLDGSKLAYVVSFPNGGRAQLWVGSAPRPPPWPRP